jgi:hypothetical protein
MATTVELELIAKTEQAQKEVTALIKRVEDLEKQNEKTAKASKGVSKSFKAIGTAFKALGIGLVVALFAKLGDALSKNQKVVDFFATAMESLGIAFSDLFDFIDDNFLPLMYKVRDFFKNLTFDKIGKAIKENITERFFSLLKVLGFVGEGLKKIFEGDFAGAIVSANEAVKEMADVFTGVNNTVDKVTETVTNAKDAIVKYTKETVKTASANVQLANTAQLAAAQQGRLVEQYDRAAEQQRQIRDEERNSIEDRIAANDKLGKVLEDQEKAMLAQADLQVASAQAQINTNDNIENQVALTEALANKEAILAQVEGFRSEQLVNDLALKKELIELDNSITDSEKARQIAQLEFEAGRETDPLKKLEAERLALEEEKVIEEERLQAKIEQYAKGTQARIDAENELKDRLQEIGNEITANSDKENEVIKKRDEALAAYKIETAQNMLSALASIAEEGSAGAKAIAVAQAVLTTYLGINKAFAETTDFTPTQSLRWANAIAAGISGFVNVKKILSTDSSGKGSTAVSAGAGGGGGASAPSFNVVGNSGVSQIGQTLNQEQEPIQAYVTSGNVTSAQELDRNIVETASIG